MKKNNNKLNSSVKNLFIFLGIMILLGIFSNCGVKAIYVNKEFKLNEQDSINYYIKKSLNDNKINDTVYPAFSKDYKTWNYNRYKCQQDTTHIIQYYKLFETKNKQFIYTVIEQDSLLLFMYTGYIY